VTSGLAHIHSRGIVHGDLKGCNVLLNSNLEPAVSDFGLSKILDEGRTATSSQGLGSSRWMSPELLGTDETKTFASDVYALGMTITEVSVHRPIGWIMRC
jgi:serine/threonine protein kinase